MSQYYKPNRNPAWNFGGANWKLSRSKIDLFLQCPRCFYIDNKMGVARPPGYPFNLNSAVDHLLKKEFDAYRKTGSKHPLMHAYGVDAVPLDHPDIDTWRENFKGIVFSDQATGFTISGAVDDIWVTPAQELIVVDYKSTSKDGEIVELEEEWHIGYKRQMEVYQWLLRKSGFKVSSRGYFVYANGIKDKQAFDGKLEFDVTLIAYDGNDSWVDPTLLEIKRTLELEHAPLSAPECDYCRYREAVHDLENIIY
jgi:CRISPR/Cas system-associated exonuclease Cas4 (RecB family)